MGGLQPWHWVVLAVVVLLLFGAKRMPDMARSLGRSMRILKAETKGLKEDDVRSRAEAQSSSNPLPPREAPLPPRETPTRTDTGTDRIVDSTAERRDQP